MKKVGVYVGIFLMIMTLIIFFVPNFGEPKTDIQYAKLGFLILSEVVFTGGFIFLSRANNTFLSAGITSAIVMYFIVNFLFVVTITKLTMLITFVSILNLVLLVLALVMINVNTHLDKKSKEIN